LYNKGFETKSRCWCFVHFVIAPIFGTPIAHWEDKLVTIIDPYKLLELKKLPEGFKNLNLTEESNPVLAFFTINATPQNISN
jgi:hypothetical protein